MRIPVWPFRRAVQLLVLASLLAAPLVARYSHYLQARQVDKLTERWEGSIQGGLLAATDAAMRLGIPDGEGGVPERRPRTAILERTREYYGSPWSARVAGLPMTDLVAGAESAAASRSMTKVLAIGLIAPLLATLLLGRVFCGWICPMGFMFDMAAKARTVARRVFEISPLSVRLWHGNKYVVLAVGLGFAALFGLPLLQYIYPPAILGREAYAHVTALFDRAEAGSLGFAMAGLTGASVLLLGVLLVEVFIAPRFFCRTICPGGALYSLLGRWRVVRIRRVRPLCTHCTLCDRVCPRGLAPMIDRTGAECDNCAMCVDVCEPRALQFKLTTSSDGIGAEPAHRPAQESAARIPGVAGPASIAASILLALLCAASPQAVGAHHILGIPHYAYDERYPQAPVMKLKETVGGWVFQMTGYPGIPRPGERSQLSIYAHHAVTGELYSKPITVTVHRRRMTGLREKVFGPATAELEENLFKYFFSYPAEGNYEVTLAFDDGEQVSTLSWPMVVGEPGSPLATLTWFTGGLGLFILSIRAIRIKRGRAVARRTRLEAAT